MSWVQVLQGVLSYFLTFMTRITRGFVARRRRNKILASVRGCRAGRSRLFRAAKQQSIKSRAYMYSGRKELKRNRRQLWIKRINAAVRAETPITTSINYSTFLFQLKTVNCNLNRKSLAQLAIYEPSFFRGFCATINKQFQEQKESLINS